MSLFASLKRRKPTKLIPGKSYFLHRVVVAKDPLITEFYSEQIEEVLFIEEFYSEALQGTIVKWLTQYGIGYNRKFIAVNNTQEAYEKEN